VRSSARPGWQQLTALVSLSAGGAITGFNFVPGTTSDLTSPTSVPVHLMALEQSAKPAQTSDGTLRSAIVNVANYYLRMAKHKTPAEMEAIIWQHDSVDGADHGQSCAAFASLMLELAAQVVGQQSWVTGGSSYPWPLHDWADARVNPNPASMGIISIQQDATAHGRWHPLADGYQPQPGDWVVFDGHVEVVTKYAPGALQTIGGDSLPNFSVNAHEFSGPLAAHGVIGFVNNGTLAAAPEASSGAQAPASGGAGSGDGAQAQASDAQEPAAVPDGSAPAITQAVSSPDGGAAIPGAAAAPDHNKGRSWLRRHADQARSRAAQDRSPARRPSIAPAGNAAGPGPAPARPATAGQAGAAGTAAIPGLPGPAHHRPARPPATPAQDQPAAAPARSQRSAGTPVAPANATSAQQAFIEQIAPGAMATQQRYGVPAAVTIAQAIDESGWGQSGLATRDHNLFGMKGTGPAGSDLQPTQEFENGQMVSVSASFRVYRDIAESIEDHGKLLATSGYYTHAMAQRHDPNAFAAALTGIYATDPQYGAKLVSLMQQYDLYRYDSAAPAPVSRGTAPSSAAIPGLPHTSPPSPRSAATPAPKRSSPPSPAPSSPSPARSPRPSSPAPSRSPDPTSSPSPAPPRSPDPPSSPAPVPSRSPEPTSRLSPAPSPSPSRSRTRSPAATPAPAQPPTPAPARAQRPARASQSAPSRPAQPARTAPPDPDRGRLPRRAPAAARAPARSARAAPAVETVSAVRLANPAGGPARRPTTRRAAGPTRKYQQPMPAAVKNAFIALAKVPIIRAEPLYRDVASNSGIQWQLLAACDWMECESRPRYSPVNGEKLGTRNSDGTVYRTKSEALAQCADDLVDLASAVYGIDLTSPKVLSVRDLANVFAAFRWGGLLTLHRTSAMEFPYSVAGLTDQHSRMRWPNIDEPNAPDRPGSRFRLPFGAVPVVLSLSYPATA
jgi:flagellum-specific peptidoglycan hydrolase FlgJ